MSPSPSDSGTINSPGEQSRRTGTTAPPHQRALGSAEHRGWMGAVYMPAALHCLRQNKKGKLFNKIDFNRHSSKNIYKWAISTRKDVCH